MQTLTLRGSSNLIQQFVDQAKQLAQEGGEIEILHNESFSQQDNWDDILQNKQVMQGLRKSIQQAKDGELLSEEETFKQLYSELGL